MAGQVTHSLSKDELAALSKDELVAYFEAGGDLAAAFEGATSNPPAEPRPAELPTLDEHTGDVAMKVKSFRLPQAMIEELESVAGRDKEGASGIVRDAVGRYLAELKKAS